MALATSTWLALGAMAASAGLQYHNTQQTARRQDNQAAAGIRQQAGKQKQIDARIGEEVSKLAASDASDERRQRLADYMQTIQRSQGTTNGALSGEFGGDAFKAAANEARGDVQQQVGEQAGLMARIDAAGMQRQGEGFGFGRLATDTGMIAREARGDAFINELRMRAIQRNPWMDAAAAGLQGYASAVGTGGAAAGGSRAGTAGYTPVAQGGRAVYGTSAGIRGRV